MKDRIGNFIKFSFQLSKGLVSSGDVNSER